LDTGLKEMEIAGENVEKAREIKKNEVTFV
jgi:hypothetical protein